MTPERYNELQHGPDPQQLTREEFEAGWHFCPEMDGLLCLLGSEDCFCCETQTPPPEIDELDFSELE